jgi:hypothetical protein
MAAFDSVPVAYVDGEAIYQCHWTGAWVRERDVIWTGSVVPGVKARYAAAPGFEDARQECVRLFHESERNCNTCNHLCRVFHNKNKAGFLYGTCNKGRMDAHPYKHLMVDGVMAFHPDDPMHMPCYESRYGR